MPGFSQMFEHGLDPIRGWFGLECLHKTAPLDATLRSGSTEVPAGRCAFLTDDGEFHIDRVSGNSSNFKTVMPHFLWHGRDANSVYNTGVSPSGSTHWESIIPADNMFGLVATGGYELQTTEFDSEQTYLPNQLLTAANSDDHGSVDAGKLTNQIATQYINWICGVASFHENQKATDDAPTGPTGTNAHGVETLTFWTYFLPEASN